MSELTQSTEIPRPRPGEQAERDLTILIPVYNEEETLEHLHRRVTDVLCAYGRSYEILFVEDGSKDRSYEILKRLHEEDGAVRVLRFSRNFGQQMAISAGLRYARGKAIVLLDADLQQAPEEIPHLVKKLGEGYDIVYGARVKRKGSAIRRLGSWFVSRLIYRITGIEIPDSASGFLALDRHFAETINLFNEKSKYLSGLFAWLSYGRWAAVPVSHTERFAGKSKYSLMQLVGLTLNLVCNFTALPLRFSLYAGLLLAALSALAFVVILGAYLAGLANGVSAALIVAALGFFSGVQLCAMGVLGEYLGRVYREVREQPSYVIRETLEHNIPNR